MARVRPPTSRVLRPRDAARHTYDRISGFYDLLEGVWERRAKAAALRQLGARPGESVLEIGFGTGHGLVSLARSVGERGRVHGLDIAEGMHRVARRRLARCGLSGRVELATGDAVALPYRTGSFDAVFMSFVLELFDTPDIPVVLTECRRVLGAGGRICVLSITNEGGPSAVRDLYEWGHRRFPNLFDCRPIYVGRRLEEAGFRIDVESLSSILGLPIETTLARAVAA